MPQWSAISVNPSSRKLSSSGVAKMKWHICTHNPLLKESTKVLWAERWAAGYQVTPHSTARRQVLSGTCCSQQNKAALVQKQSISCSSSSNSSTYYIISSRCSAPGCDHTNTCDGIHRQVGQGIGDVSHLRHYGLILEERSRIKGLLGSTPQQKPENQEHTCMPQCLC